MRRGIRYINDYSKLEDVSIEVLNGTNKTGLAKKVGEAMEYQGYRVLRIARIRVAVIVLRIWTNWLIDRFVNLIRCKELFLDMEQLWVRTREITNKRMNRRLRKEGKVPAVVYGVGGVHHLLVDAREFKKKFTRYTNNTVLFLVDCEEKKERCVFVQDMQCDLVKGTITHLDFLEVDKDKPLIRQIPLLLTGAAPGVKEGGSLFQLLKEITIKAAPVHIPENMQICISHLNIGDSIKIKDLSLPAEVEVLHKEDQEIVHVK
ncbi:UNVERIFIED_CONTAM: hypothetical protein PYX00_011061 [Menopon gallinae]|uniref:50S ribosomal protein L25 n=1 Tax=Menopon gallinae TaxID=328185 RepID=A0AAW2H749_9NEOP